MNKEYQSFMIILYPDDDTHIKALNYIEDNFSYAYILHNLDIDDDGNLKKPHYHVIIHFSDSEKHSISWLSDTLSIPCNYITHTKKSYIHGLRYLVHADDKNKYQYDPQNVVGPLTETLLKSLKNEIENLKVREIIDLIENYNGVIDIKDFSKVMCELNLYSYYRRSFAILHLIIKEHNFNYSQK